MRNDVSNQIRFAGALATGNNRGLADVRMPAQRRFDFAGLDTIAADLNLTIRAAAVLDVTVRQITSEIAGATQLSRLVEYQQLHLADALAERQNLFCV